MTKHWFSLSLPEEKARTMNRTQYKAAMSWLRNCRRIITEKLNKKGDMI